MGVGWAQAGRRLGGGWAEGVRSSQAGGVGSGRADPELYSCAARATGTPSTAQPRSCAQAAVHARWASSRHRRRAGRLRQGGMYSSAGSSAIDKVVARGVARDPAAPPSSSPCAAPTPSSNRRECILLRQLSICPGYKRAKAKRDPDLNQFVRPTPTTVVHRDHDPTLRTDAGAICWLPKCMGHIYCTRKYIALWPYTPNTVDRTILRTYQQL